MEIKIIEIDFDTAESIHKKIPEFDSYIKAKFGRCKKEKHLVLGAFVDGKKAGYSISFDRYKDGSLYIWMAGVLPRYRNKGILNKMMQYITKWAKKNRFNKLKIKTRNNRREMIHFLTKNNFLFMQVQLQNNLKENRIFLEKEI